MESTLRCVAAAAGSLLKSPRSLSTNVKLSCDESRSLIAQLLAQCDDALCLVILHDGYCRRKMVWISHGSHPKMSFYQKASHRKDLL